jgi:hypothetical protein
VLDCVRVGAEAVTSPSDFTDKCDMNLRKLQRPVKCHRRNVVNKPLTVLAGRIVLHISILPTRGVCRYFVTRMPNKCSSFPFPLQTFHPPLHISRSTRLSPPHTLSLADFPVTMRAAVLIALIASVTLPFFANAQVHDLLQRCCGLHGPF